jgi:hypothetical protein
MGRHSISKDPTRQAFQHVGNDCWECKDYRTFYMSIRPTNSETDIRRGRNPDHYVLMSSSGDIIDGIESLPKAFTVGYNLADDTYESRYPGLV